MGGSMASHSNELIQGFTWSHKPICNCIECNICIVIMILGHRHLVYCEHHNSSYICVSDIRGGGGQR